MGSSLCYLALESDIGLISNTVSTTKGALMGKLCTPYTNLTWPVFGPKIWANKFEAPSATVACSVNCSVVTTSTVNLTSFFNRSRSLRCSFATARALSEAMRAASLPCSTDRPACRKWRVSHWQQEECHWGKANSRHPRTRRKHPAVSEVLAKPALSQIWWYRFGWKRC